MITTLIFIAPIFSFFSQPALAAQSPAYHYQTSCYQAGDDTLSSSMQFQGTNWTQKHTAFEDEACQTPYLIYSTTYQAPANIQASKVTASGPVDLKVTEVSYTLLTDEVARALNMSGWCGFSDWKANVPKVVTGLQCDDYAVPALNSTLYTTYDISIGSHGPQLHMGDRTDAQNGSSPDKRATTLEALTYYLDSSN